MSHARSNAVVPLALALAALSGAGCGSEETRSPAPPAAAPAPTPAAPAPAAPTPAPAAGAMKEWKGELPSDFPGDVPQYPGAKVASAKGSGEVGIAVTFDSADPTETVAKFYTDTLASMGWQTQTQTSDDGTMIFGDKEDRTLQAMVRPGGQATLVEVIVSPAR